MAAKTRSIVRDAHPEVLAHAASALVPVSAAIERKAGELHAKVTGLDWKGAARDGAVTRADWEKTQMTRVADAVEELGEAFTSGSSRMAPMVANLNTSASNLENDLFSVEDDWTVRDLRDYASEERRNEGDSTALSEIAEARRIRGEEATNETIRLQRLAQELHTADVDTKRAISEAEELIRTLTPVTAGLSIRQSEIDLQALKDGRLSPAGRERLRRATSLSPGQLEALREGQVTEISQGQYNYLSNIMTELETANMDDLLRVHNAAPGLLGDALRIMSTPNVHTKAGSTGGLDRLPDSVVSLLRENPIEYTTAGTSTGYPFSFAGVPRLDDFKALNTILSDRTDRALQLGTDVDRGVLKQASEIVGALPDGDNNLFGLYDENQSAEDVRKLASSMLTNSSHDRQAVTDFLTGERMDVTVAEGHRYDADAHVLNILTERWSADGAELRGDGDLSGGRDLFDWIGAAAPSEGYEGQLGGRAADALARILIEHENDLDSLVVDQDATGNNRYETVGDRNALLSQVLAKNLAPYFGNFAGAPDEVLVNHTAEPLEDTIEFSKLIGVLSTDPGAGRVALSAAVQWENFLAHEYGSDPENSELATAAAKMHKSMDDGLTNALSTLADNDQWERLREYNEKSFLIDSAGGLLASGGLKVPGLSEVAGMAVPLVKMDEVALPTADPGADEAAWRTELKDLGTSLDKLTAGPDRVVQVTAGFLEDRPDLWGKPWRTDSGSVYFVKSDGTLDIAVVQEHKEEFRAFATGIGAERIRFDYNEHYRESIEDPTIDDVGAENSKVADRAPN
ncbi:hypothetical protein O4157_03825 [Gordonia amicalis]|uniref:TPR repeat domain-containing protein n=1 Tax=Gordonia amicalis TaxID=89053 RepID=A0AAE4R7P3_9ACTN|nr:hypothetical protein [Gordonia amicalis]MCZ4650562.1 hypothetical protein [Gordonia amicalis]MDV6314574.1 hypothetical protein [Gordonia amicalis]